MFRLTALLAITLISATTADNEESQTSSTTTPQPPQPVYSPPQQSPGYIPHQTYPFPDSYGGSLYDGFFYPQMVPAKPQVYSEQQQPPPNYAVIPAAQNALQFTLKVLAKFGLFVLGGATLLLIGGIFTTIICHLTPICVISFPALGGLDKESVRSLMTPDRISAAAALVQDALGKYQRLQRAART